MEWLSVVLGGGLVATIGAIFQGLKMLREGGAAKAAKLMSDLERARTEEEARTRAARDDSEWYLDLADYWRTRAGAAEFAAERGGIDLPDPDPLPVRPAPKVPEV